MDVRHDSSGPLKEAVQGYHGSAISALHFKGAISYSLVRLLYRGAKLKGQGWFLGGLGIEEGIPRG